MTAVLLWMNWQLALFILLLNPLVIYFTTVLGKKVKDLKKQENSAFELFQQALIETLDAIQQIRAAQPRTPLPGRVMDRARRTSVPTPLRSRGKATPPAVRRFWCSCSASTSFAASAC